MKYNNNREKCDFRNNIFVIIVFYIKHNKGLSEKIQVTVLNILH